MNEIDRSGSVFKTLKEHGQDDIVELFIRNNAGKHLAEQVNEFHLKIFFEQNHQLIYFYVAECT